MKTIECKLGANSEDSISESKEMTLQNGDITGNEQMWSNSIVNGIDSVLLPHFENIDANVILCDEDLIKEDPAIVCSCTSSGSEKVGDSHCGSTCLNRMLYTECGSRCPCGFNCANRRFHNREYARTELFYAGLKGWGLRTLEPLEPGSFIIEYVGEVIDPEVFQRRVKRYGKDPEHVHHYFMALKNGAVIDATIRGNASRFLNHSCDPNCRTEKWAVNRQMRIGFFAIRTIAVGEEIVFDYQLERYGRKAQTCFCGSENCRGLIGVENNAVEDEASESGTVESSEDEVESDCDAIRENLICRKKQKERNKQIRTMNKVVKAAVRRGPPKSRKEVETIAQLMAQVLSASHGLALIKCLRLASADILRIFMQKSGLRILNVFLANDYPHDDRYFALDLCVKTLDLLEIMPITTRNQVNDSQLFASVKKLANHVGPIDEVVQETVDYMLGILCGDSPSVSIPENVRDSFNTRGDLENLHFILSNKIKKLLAAWQSLREEYRIPRTEKSGTPDDEKSSRDVYRRPVLAEIVKKSENSWKPLRIIPPRNIRPENYRKRGFSSPSGLAGAPAARRSRFDVAPRGIQDGSVPMPSCMNRLPPMLIPESFFDRGLPRAPVSSDYSWNPFCNPVSYFNCFPGYYQQSLQPYQRQFSVSQDQSLQSILEAPSPPNDGQILTSGRKTNIIIIEIDMNCVTDENIETIEKHLMALKAKRNELRNNERLMISNIIPPPPPQSTSRKSNWVQATTEEGTVYYYNKETRESSWVLPDENDDADTTSTPGEIRNERRVFKTAISRHVASVLEPIRKTKFKCFEDYRHVWRKLTKAIIAKEMKRIGEGEQLKFTDSVKEKAERYLSDYLTRLDDSRNSGII